MQEDVRIISSSDLHRFVKSGFLALKCSDEHAQTAADVLIAADLRGIDSHGIARMSGYARLFKAGRINPNPRMKIVREKKSVFTLDADSALGLVSAPFAMELVLKRAEEFGSSYAAVSNSNHFGIAAYHAMLALNRSMIGMAMTNASPLVAPTHSKERMLGTNPICYAIPAKNQFPFVMDMASSAAANGKLEIAERKSTQIPLGWLEDKNGNSSRAPGDLREGGYLLPLGSDPEHGEHKGYALGSLVDILSGVLSGANFGPWVPPFVAFLPVLPDLPGKGIGHFLGAMDPDGFMDKNDFLERMDLWVTRFKDAKPKSGEEVLIPGEPEFRMRTIRAQKGIPINPMVREDLITLARQLKIEHPF